MNLEFAKFVIHLKSLSNGPSIYGTADLSNFNLSGLVYLTNA